MPRKSETPFVGERGFSKRVVGFAVEAFPLSSLPSHLLRFLRSCSNFHAFKRRKTHKAPRNACRYLDIRNELHSRCYIFHKHWIFLYTFWNIGKKLKGVFKPASFKGTLSFPQFGYINYELHQSSNFVWHIIGWYCGYWTSIYELGKRVYKLRDERITTWLL